MIHDAAMWFRGTADERNRLVAELMLLLDDVGPAGSDVGDPAPSQRTQVRDLMQLRDGVDDRATIYLRGGWRVTSRGWGKPGAMYQGPTVVISAAHVEDQEVRTQAFSTFVRFCGVLQPLQGAVRRHHGRGLLAFDYAYPSGGATFVQISPEVYERFIALTGMDDYWLGYELAHRAGLSTHGFLSEMVADADTREQLITSLLAPNEDALAPYVLLDQRPRHQ